MKVFFFLLGTDVDSCLGLSYKHLVAVMGSPNPILHPHSPPSPFQVFMETGLCSVDSSSGEARPNTKGVKSQAHGEQDRWTVSRA